MRRKIARHHQPGVTASTVIPKLPVRAIGIFAQIDIVGPFLGRLDAAILGAAHGGVAMVQKLFEAAFAAMGAGYTHGKKTPKEELLFVNKK
jgi:hypothetical protein